MQKIWLALMGIAINVLLAFVLRKIGNPLYLDCVGTITVSAIGGQLPGIFTAVATSMVCALFNHNAPYFSFVNAIIAIVTVWFFRKYSYKNKGKLALFTLATGVLTGVIYAVINWNLLDGAKVARDSDTTVIFSSSMGMSLFGTYLIYLILVNILDKAIAVGITWLILRAIPNEKLIDFERSNWKQTPLSADEIDTLNTWGSDTRYSMQSRNTMIILTSSVLLVAVTAWIGVSLYFNSAKEDKSGDAFNALKFADEVIDPSLVNDYIYKGKDAEGYAETMRLLKNINDYYKNVERLYFIKIEKDGAVPIFAPESENGSMGREKIAYDEELLPYLPDLLAGKNIPPVESGELSNWKRSVFYPIFDDHGRCALYGVAEVSLSNMSTYMWDFAFRTILILLGFVILVVANSLWVTNVTMVYPIRSMAKVVDDFADKGYSQEQLDANVKSIRALDIRTQDEVEKLYDSICNMTLNLSEQMRDLRRLSDTTARMQDGLIITMADMVENRDSDTGAHIQKTAAYVSIIVEGLKQKGYYAEKITPKFISDVVRSAPLHDIGKINIPDEVLNKPGKLTEEEYEIMKTHTTVGKKIMENAISTVEGENYLKEARNMAAYHHERWDGKGYPEGLHGEVIPLSARIMAVADVFDALTSQRVYKPAFPLDKALDIITEGAGTQFDPKCVEVLLDNLSEVKVILKKYNKDI